LSHNHEKSVEGQAKAHRVIRFESEQGNDYPDKKHSTQTTEPYPHPHSQPDSLHPRSRPQMGEENNKVDRTFERRSSDPACLRRAPQEERHSGQATGSDMEGDHEVDGRYAGPDVVYDNAVPAFGSRHHYSGTNHVSTHQNGHDGSEEGPNGGDNQSSKSAIPAPRPLGHRYQSHNDRPPPLLLFGQGNVHDQSDMALGHYVSSGRAYSPLGGFPTGSGQAGKWS